MPYGGGPVIIISRQTKSGDTARAATSEALKMLRRDVSALKELVADLTLENLLLNRVWAGMRRARHEISCT